MNAGLEKATPAAMPVQPRTRAGLTSRRRAKHEGACPASSSRRSTSLYKFVSHTRAHSQIGYPPALSRGGGGGGRLEANQGASVHAAGTVYDPGGVRTSYGRLDKV